MSEPDVAELAERLHAASDRERYEALVRAAASAEAGGRLRRAGLLLRAAGVPIGGEADPEEVALELARHRVSRASLTDPQTLDWLLRSVVPPGSEAGAMDRASGATRRSMRAVVRPARRRFRIARWAPAWGAAAAAVLVVVLATPATAPWARQLELSRWRALRLPHGLVASVRTALEDGRGGAPLFDVPPGMSRRERDSLATGLTLPHLARPRWEAVAEARPVFRWLDGDESAEFEILVVDAGRDLVWSAGVGRARVVAYPEDAPPLVTGETYYWKVNRLGDAQLAASAWAGFRVLDAAERRALARDLARAGAHPFLRGAAYDRHGLYGPAAESFAAAAERAKLSDAASRMLDAVHAKQGLGE